MANIVVAYICWFFGGLGGLHHFYLGRDLHSFVWWSSLGGLGLGWFRDLWRLPEYVFESNQDPRYINEFAHRRTKYQKPPFSSARFAGQLLIGKYQNNEQLCNKSKVRYESQGPSRAEMPSQNYFNSKQIDLYLT